MANQDFEILLKVRADVNEALGGIRSLTDSIGGIKNSIVGIAGTLGLAFGVSEIVGFAKSIVDAEASLVDLNKTTGISVENLSVLEYAAHKVGIANEDLNTGLARLAVAAAKNKPAFQAMGISLDDASGHLKSTDVLLEEIAKKFDSYKDGPEKAALANELFGRSGYQLIPLLDQLGNQGLANLTAKAKEAGAVVGGEAAIEAKKFNDALDDMKDAASGAVRDGLNTLLPQVTTLAETFKDPAFKKALADIAGGIADLGVAAAKAIPALVQMYTDAKALVGFRLDGNIDAAASSGFQQGAQAEQQAHLDSLNAQIAQRQNDAAGGLIDRNIQLAKSVTGVLSTAGESDYQTAKDALKSTKDLIAERDALALKVAADQKQVDAAKTRDFMAGQPHGTPQAPTGADGNKQTAPIVDASKKGADDAKAMAAALLQLQNQLASLKTQGLDPTATAWAQYNKIVADATATAKKAGDTPDALNALKSITAEAARIRDAALDKILQADRDAYEQLKKSLDGPVETKLDDARKQIEGLNKALKDGIIQMPEYNAELKKIGDKTATALPEFNGISPVVGGNFSELTRVDEASKKLDEAYAQQKQIIEEYYASISHDEADYYARSLALDKKYSDEKDAIDRARVQVTLQGITASFDQGANVIKQGFGEQSKAYRIAFAASKAAAIAEATVAMFQDIAQASKVGFPANIALIAEAAAQGLSIIGSIRAIEVGPSSSSSSGTGMATGGAVRGPGSGTSDSIPAMLSNGEFVHNAAAVNHYGLDVMHAINTMRLPKFADGGPVQNLFANAPHLPAANDNILTPAALAAAAAAGNGGNAGAQRPVSLRIVNVTSEDATLQHMSGAAGEQLIMNTISRNESKLKQLVR